MGVHGGAAAAPMGSARGAAELAQALAQIAAEDPEGAEALGSAIGLRPGATPAAAPAPSGGPSGLFDLGADPSEDFDVDVTLPVAVVGGSGTGKSSLVRRFARGGFAEEWRRTLVDEFVEKRRTLGRSGEEVTFHIWDTPGSEDPRTSAERCCKRAKACVIVFSTDDRSSFEAVENWVAAVRRACSSGVLLVLVLTKRDLLGGAEAEVSEAEAEALAAQVGAPLCMASARDSSGISEVFDHVGEELLRRQMQAEENFRSGEAMGGLQWGDLGGPPGGAAWAEGAGPNIPVPAGARAVDTNSGAGLEEEDDLELPLP